MPASSEPRYSITDVESLTGISAFTLRYYDKCGFFPNLHRISRGVRRFSDADIAQLHLVEALRRSGLSIEGIQYFVRLGLSGSNADERLRILRQQLAMLEIQRDELVASMERMSEAIEELDEAARA